MASPLRLLKLSLLKSLSRLLQLGAAASFKLKELPVIELSRRHSLYHPMLLNLSVAEAMAKVSAAMPMGDSMNTT